MTVLLIFSRWADLKIKDSEYINLCCQSQGLHIYIGPFMTIISFKLLNFAQQRIFYNVPYLHIINVVRLKGIRKHNITTQLALKLSSNYVTFPIRQAVAYSAQNYQTTGLRIVLLVKCYEYIGWSTNETRLFTN